MIDVLLVLLVIFMVVSPLGPTGLPALVPQAPIPGPEPPAAGTDLVLSVHRDGSVSVKQEAVALASLAGRLAEVFKFRGDHVVFARGEKGLEYRQVAQVLAIARGAGMTRVVLMTTAVRQ